MGEGRENGRMRDEMSSSVGVFVWIKVPRLGIDIHTQIQNQGFRSSLKIRSLFR